MASIEEDIIHEKDLVIEEPKGNARKSIVTAANNNQIELSISESESYSNAPKINSIIVGRRFKCIFRAHNKNKLRWDLYIMLLATLNCFQVPYTLAFEEDGNEPLYISILNWFLDLSFMVDLIIGFRSAYVNEKTGKEIVEAKRIALQYLKGRFIIDLLASIPFDIFILIFFRGKSGGSGLQLFSLLKLVRVLRLSKLITFMNLQDDMKMSLKLAKLVFFLILYLH